MIKPQPSHCVSCKREFYKSKKDKGIHKSSSIIIRSKNCLTCSKRCSKIYILTLKSNYYWKNKYSRGLSPLP